MAIKISKKILSEFPPTERAGLEKRLIEKAKGVCTLCDQPLEEHLNTVVADHEKPVKLGGKTTFANLNLVHSSCNSAKRNSLSVDVRPYLRFRAFLKREVGPNASYDDCLKHKFFKISKPQPCVLEWSVGDPKAKFVFKQAPPGLQIQITPVFKETPHEESEPPRAPVYSTYVDVPIQYLSHDQLVQPRAIRLEHVYNIYKDLALNPLHEAPACRAESGPKTRLLMFDGQHKTLAKLMAGSGGVDTVVTKVYLGMTVAEADFLVNSIQSESVKLKLTKLDSAAKMAREFDSTYAAYQAASGGKDTSERGYLESLPASRQPRGEREIRASVVHRITALKSPKLNFLEHLDKKHGITQTVYLNKMLKQLAEFGPIETKDKAREKRRATEARNVVTVLNAYWETCIAPGLKKNASTNDILRSDRMLKQSSLDYTMAILKPAIANALALDADEVFRKRRFTDDDVKKLYPLLKRIRDHDVWTIALDNPNETRPKVLAVSAAVSKHQGGPKAFADVGLDPGYVAGLNPPPPNAFE